MPLLVVVRIKNHLDIVEKKTGSWVRAVVEMAGVSDDLASKVNQKLYTSLRDKLYDKLASSGVDCLIDGGCCSPSEVVLFVSATDLNQKTLSQKKGKLVGFIATKMVTKNFKVSQVEKMLLKKIPAKLSEALQSTGVDHEMVVKLVKVYSSEEVETKISEEIDKVNADLASKSFLESYSRSVFCVFFNTTGYPLQLVSAKLVLGAWSNTQLYPPELIGPNCSGKWENVSNQMITGVQGECVYKLVSPEASKTKGKEKKKDELADIGKVSVVITWLNPYAGSNNFEVKIITDEGRETPFVATYQGGNGSNSAIFFRLHMIEEDAESKGARKESLGGPTPDNSKDKVGELDTSGTTLSRSSSTSSNSTKGPPSPITIAGDDGRFRSFASKTAAPPSGSAR